MYVDLKLFDVHDTSSPHAAYKLSVSSGLRELSCVNPAEVFKNSLCLFLCIHALVCSITRISTPPHVCSTCHTIFSLKKTFKCICERLLHCRLSCHNLDPPTNDLDKLPDTQSVYHSVVKVKKLWA